MARTTSTSSPGWMVSVAPKWRAVSSLDGTMSMAMIWRAPARRAPWITEQPTPPQPNTATDDPGVTLAVLRAAPTPVVTPQPTREATSSGRSSAIFTTARSWTSITSAKPDRSANWRSGMPSRLRRGGSPLGRMQKRRSVHRWGRPSWHCLHVPQYIEVQATTWSPGWTEATLDPTASTIPAGSWPGTVGRGPAIDPFMKWRSLWQTPQAEVRRRTSLGAGSSTSIVSIVIGPPISRNTAARAFMPPSLSCVGGPAELGGLLVRC